MTSASRTPLRIARVRPLDAPADREPEAFFVACDADNFEAPEGRRWTVTTTPFPASPSNAASPGRPGWEEGDVVDQSSFAFLSPCVPANVLGMAHNTGAAGRALPPQAFHKAATSVIGQGDAIEVPADSRVEPEAELAIVVGRRARGLTLDSAMDAVLGFTIGNDVTDRAAQATDELWISAKSADTFSPLGPWIVTRRPGADAEVRVAIDGEPLPAGRIADLGWGLEEILVYASSLMTLHPGDAILSGFPGAAAPIVAGNVVECSVGGIGTLRNRVIAVPVSSPSA
ncbi:fumarylacetoacetate hydrolase family protein [Sinomonas sp. ASV322]|uniref:fumarylacetoacetate hydrolase family protein n=1 Tax=Sinomonas sp. ASV322 TaxID=3041920 RepID=UPI0027DE1552|nr:fumarylacetoacetate hydrolase family protein [Sinomonas sp. ASV322]MDQ4502144.1 fumarylacetoacetate hydrolase family protein [Sinomonas sp. ASV322]